MRWKFIDLTYGSDLTVKVLETLPYHTKGLLHRVELVNLGKNGEEPFDVGTVITLMAKPAKGHVRGQQAGFYPGYETCVLPFGHFNGSEKWERLN